MKKILALTIFGLCSLMIGHAQTKPVGKVQGTLVSGQKPVESATIELLRVKDSSVAKISVSDKAGAFEIENIQPGNFFLLIQALGHARYYSPAFAITDANPVQSLPVIGLTIATKELSAVTVVSKKPLIEQKIDRTIVNVEASITNVGTSALDVLEKSPGVTVDKDGNISLKGKSGVQIYVDGRPTYLSGQDLTNMLKNMQSEQLDQLEIMTNPPAKYDAAGNAGVINLKTKKNKQVGYNGSATVGYGQGVYASTTESLNLNYRNGKVNLFSNLSYGYRQRFQTLTIQRKFIDAATKIVKSNFSQENNILNNGEPYSVKLGMDYFASKKTTLGVVFNGGVSDYGFSSGSVINIADPNQVLLSQTRAISNNSQNWKNFSTNLNLRQLLGKKGAEITSDLDYIQYRSSNQQNLYNAYYDASGNSLPGSRPDTLLGNLPQDITIYSAKLDFMQPLKNGARFEAGGKTSYVKTDANAQYDSLINGAHVQDINRSNHFVYEEMVNAAYVNFSRPLGKKFNAQLGLRMEHTHSSGKQLTTHIDFTRDYVQLFPTFYLQYQPNEKNSFVLNYGRRITRPDYESLNPFVTFLDRYTYEQGNPNLQPQFSHNIELSHTFHNFLTTTLNYTNTTDIIQQVLEQNTSKNETYVKTSNIASQRQYGISVNAFFPITKWWTSNLYANVYNNRFHGIINGDLITVGATTGVFNAIEQFKFKNGWGLEASGFYRTESVEGVFRIKPLGSMNVGVSKQVLHNKGSIKLGVRDIFWTQRGKGESKFSNIDAEFQQFQDSRVVNFSFTYRFSKGKVGNVQRQRGGASEEANRVKGGGN
ncbi:MAG: TonB-dependent receptor [Bacteroidota bacterium]|nr:TonB-dependent receptor [Bacteroidota bacterium]